MNPAEIARGLTAAQRRALLWLPADGSERPWYAGSGHFDGHKDLRRMRLASGKIDRGRSTMMRWLTGLGVQVRAEVERMEEENGNVR
jgi:hypothetical protein